MNSGYTFFIGWGIIGALFYGGVRFESSRTIIYYILWLSIVLMLVTHAPQLSQFIQGAIPGAQGGITGSAPQIPSNIYSTTPPSV